MNALALLLTTALTANNPFAIEKIDISQEHSSVIISFSVTYHGQSTLILKPEKIEVTYEAEVANSRLPNHAFCLTTRSKFFLSEKGVAPLIHHFNQNKNECREIISGRINLAAVQPNEKFQITFTIEHDHFLYNIDPLLGGRKFQIKISDWEISGEAVFDSPDEKLKIKPVTLSYIPKGHLDERYSFSNKPSLYLAADIPGCQCFRFGDIPTTYDAKFKVSFYYLIALGTEGECRARVMEYQDRPGLWKKIDDGGFDELLEFKIGWQKFEKEFQTTKDTTTMALDFRIAGAEIGEMWISDIKFEPVISKKELDIRRGRKLHLNNP